MPTPKPFSKTLTLHGSYVKLFRLSLNGLLIAKRAVLQYADHWRQQHRVPYIDLRDLGAGHGVILYDPAVLVKWAQQYGVEPEE